MSSDVLFFLIELVLLVGISMMMFQLVNEISHSTLLEKNFLARDLALLVDTVYASPNVVRYVYDGDASQFTVALEPHTAKVREDQDKLDKTYWYADTGNEEVQASLRRPEHIILWGWSGNAFVTDNLKAQPIIRSPGPMPVSATQMVSLGIPSGKEEIMQYICLVASKYQAPGDLMLAIAEQESGFDTSSESGDNGHGLFQVTYKSTDPPPCKEPSLIDGRKLNPIGAANWKDNVECGIQLYRNKCKTFPACASGTGEKEYCCKKTPTDDWSACLCEKPDCAGEIMKDEHYKGWDVALRGYNGWGCKAGSPAADFHTLAVTKAIQNYVESINERRQKYTGVCPSSVI